MRHGLRDAREVRSLTQFELVGEIKRRFPTLKLSRTAISKYEQGAEDIPGRVLEALSVVLEKPMDDLYADDEGTDNFAPSPEAPHGT